MKLNCGSLTFEAILDHPWIFKRGSRRPFSAAAVPIILDVAKGLLCDEVSRLDKTNISARFSNECV
jgi:hypothetical protein